MFKWRLENKSTTDFLDTLYSWWEKHEAFNKKSIEYKSLPSRIFVVSNDTKDLFAVPVYISDSDFCYIGWVTSNPDATLREKTSALDYLYNIISIVMKSQGFDHIISKANAKSLQRVAERNGFINVGETTYHIKNL